MDSNHRRHLSRRIYSALHLTTLQPHNKNVYLSKINVSKQLTYYIIPKKRFQVIYFLIKLVPPSGLEPERPKPTHFKCVEFANFSKVAILAETIGFEPMEAINLVGFQDRFIKPDSDTFPQSCLSTIKLSKIKVSKQLTCYIISNFQKMLYIIFRKS